TPNLMVVVPTRKHVELTFGTSAADQAGRVLTVVGVLGLGALVWWGLAARLPQDSGIESRRGRVRFPSRSRRCGPEAPVASAALCYFAAGPLDAPAAMFTASNNPAQYNGVKLCRAGALPIGQDTGLAEIKAMVAGGLMERAEDPGRAEHRDLLPAFVAHVH